MKRKALTLLHLLCSITLITGPATARAADGADISGQAPPALQRLVATVLPDHPRLQASKAELARAEAGLRGADKAVYNPELEIDAERTDVDTRYLQLSQAIDMGDQRGARTSVADAELRRARARYIQERQALMRDLLQAIAEDTTNRALARLATRRLELMREFADLAERRHRAGDLDQVELELARLAYSEALMNNAAAQAEAAAARQRLQALFGSVPAEAPLPENLPAPQLPTPVDDFVRRLPVMQAIEADVAAARQTVELRRAERSWDPTIAVRGGAEDDNRLIGATLTVPLKVRNPLRAEVEAAQQALIAAEQQAQQAFRDQKALLLAVTARYRLVQVAWSEWQRTGRSSIKRQLALIKRLWQAGDMSTTDYLVQLKQALETEAAGLELRGRVWNSSFEWLYTTARLADWLNNEEAN